MCYVVAFCPENEEVVMATFSFFLVFFMFCVVFHSGEAEEPVGPHPAQRGGAAAAAQVHAGRQPAVARAEAGDGASHRAVRDPSANAPAGPKRDAWQADCREQSKTIYASFFSSQIPKSV